MNQVRTFRKASYWQQWCKDNTVHNSYTTNYNTANEKGDKHLHLAWEQKKSFCPISWGSRIVTPCGHSLCWVCVCAPVRESLCLLWRETHTKGLTARSPARPEVDEERKVPEKIEKIESQLTKGRQGEAVDNGEQTRTVSSR